MGTVRFLFCAPLLLGGCDLLWNPFQGPNPAYCDPAAPGCAVPSADGGADGADLAMDPTGDGGSSPDLTCTPGPASPWVADPSPPGAATIALSGVTGNGAGDLWVVGPPSYAAHRAGGWNTIALSALITTVGRMVYAPAQAQAMVAAGSTAGGEIVYLNKTTAPLPDLVTVAPETVSGLWVSAAPESTPYLVGSAGTVQSFANGLSWVGAGSPAPARLTAVAGFGMAATTTLWASSATDNLVAAYSQSSNSWRMLTTGTSAINGLWASATGGVSLVGKNGVIMGAPATVPPIGPLAPLASPVTTTLTDVAGTANGKHLFAVGAGGAVLHWESVCRRWTAEPSPTAQGLNALFVSDPENTVWAVGNNGTLLHRAIP